MNINIVIEEIYIVVFLSDYNKGNEIIICTQHMLKINNTLTVVDRDEWIIDSNDVDIVLLRCRTHYQTVSWWGRIISEGIMKTKISWGEQNNNE
jgi:hypothetical protein